MKKLFSVLIIAIVAISSIPVIGMGILSNKKNTGISESVCLNTSTVSQDTTSNDIISAADLEKINIKLDKPNKPAKIASDTILNKVKKNILKQTKKLQM